MRSMGIRSEIICLFLIAGVFLVVFAEGSNFYYTQGIIAFNAGDYVKAEKYLKTALILNPALENNSDIKYMIGLSAWYAGDLVTARAYLPEEHLTMIASSTKLVKRNLVAEIAKWESLSSPIINVESRGKKKEVPKSWGFLIFLSFFSIIMGSFFAYKFSKKMKLHRRRRTVEKTDEEVMDDFGTEEPFIASRLTAQEEPIEMPENGPAEDEVKMKLQNLLKSGYEAEEEKMQLVEEPEKIIEETGIDASQEEIERVEEAVQELLSRESQNVET